MVPLSKEEGRRRFELGAGRPCPLSVEGVVPRSSVHLDRAVHSGFHVAWKQAGVLKSTYVLEGPDDLAALARPEPEGVGVVVIHVGGLLHHGLVLEIVLLRVEDDLVIERARILYKKPDRLSFLHIEFAGNEVHAAVGLSHDDFYGAIGLGGFARPSDCYVVSMFAIVVRAGMTVVARAGGENGIAAKEKGGGEEQKSHRLAFRM